jgi:integrase
MSAFERPKGSGKWRAKFVLNGRQVWVPGSPFPSESAADAAEDRHRDRLLARLTNETCASFVDRWLEEWPRPAAATRRQYADAVKRFAAHFGPTPLGEVERLSARTWALSVPRYVSRTVRTMYEDARNVGLVEDNPFSNLRLPGNQRKRRVTVPSMDDYRALVAASTVLGGYGAEFRALLAFASWTGVRSGELQAIEWRDLGTDSIWIRRSRKRDGTVGLPKNGEEREIIFPPPARILDDVPRRSDDDLVFHSPRGFALDQGSLYWAWREVRATAGVRHVRFHDLRHFCATQLLEMGVDHFAVSVQLGHTDGGAEVMRTYGHPSHAAARRRLLAAFEGEIGSWATESQAQDIGGRA